MVYFSSLNPLVLWGRVNHSTWCACYFCSLEGVSYRVRKDQPYSSWILVTVDYRRQIYFHLDCYKSLDGVYEPILVTGGYHLWVIPDRIWVSREIINIFGVIFSCIEVGTYILSIRGISDALQIFPTMKALHVDWL